MEAHSVAIYLPRKFNVSHQLFVTSELGLKYGVASNLARIYQFLCEKILQFLTFIEAIIKYEKNLFFKGKLQEKSQ